MATTTVMPRAEHAAAASCPATTAGADHAGGKGHHAIRGDHDTGGGKGHHAIRGGDGGDGINGGKGHDVIRGGGGDDTISGGKGRDRLFGDDGKDRLNGDDGADTLIGGAGSDTLDGGQGDDVLIGGPGVGGTGPLGAVVGDLLTGGAGADRFVYRAVADSPAFSTSIFDEGRDFIRDFSQSEGDKIDFSAIDADTTLPGKQAFTFEPTNASRPDRGEVGFSTVPLVLRTFVRVNTDDDPEPEMEMLVEGLVNFTADDFIL